VEMQVDSVNGKIYIFNCFLGVGGRVPVLGLPRLWTAVLGLGIWE